MTTSLRSARLLALAAWFGALVFFGFVAFVAFSSLPDAHLAGAVVRGCLILLHRLGLAAGCIYLVFTIILLMSQRDTHPVRIVELIFVVSMLALTAYSQFSIMPQMERDRLAVGGDIAKAPQDAPEVHRFNRLHGLSVKLEGVVLIEAALLLLMAPVHGRDHFDRFA